MIEPVPPGYDPLGLWLLRRPATFIIPTAVVGGGLLLGTTVGLPPRASLLVGAMAGVLMVTGSLQLQRPNPVDAFARPLIANRETSRVPVGSGRPRPRLSFRPAACGPLLVWLVQLVVALFVFWFVPAWIDNSMPAAFVGSLAIAVGVGLATRLWHSGARIAAVGSTIYYGIVIEILAAIAAR